MKGNDSLYIGHRMGGRIGSDYKLLTDQPKQNRYIPTRSEI